MRRSRTNVRITMAALTLVLHLNAEATTAGVVAVVSADNPLNNLSRIELANIFLGKSGHFPNGTPAKPIDLQENAPARSAFYEAFAGKSAAQVKAHWSKMIFTGRGRPPRAMKDGEQVKQWVADNPGAIGYLDEHLVDDSIKVVNVQQ